MIPAPFASPIQDKGLLGLFGPEPAGNGLTYLACGPAAEITFLCSIGLVVATKTIYLCRNLEMLIHEKRYEKFERTQIFHRGMQIHRFLTRAKVLGNLDNL